MLQELNNELNSIIKSLDIVYVKEGLKPVSRIIIDNPGRITKILETNNLAFAMSDFKVVKLIDKTRNFSDKAIKVDANDKRPGEYFMYISRNQDQANEAKEFEANDDDYNLGLILGYPSCCSKFFAKNKEEASNKNFDLVPFTFNNSSGHTFPWKNNYCLRVFDISLISHFPCSFNCEKTKTIAGQNLELLRILDSDIANYFSSSLKSVVIYSVGVGVYSLKDAKRIENIISYKTVIPSKKNDFFNLLTNNKFIKLKDKNNFQVNNAVIDDPQTFLALFS